MGNHICEECSRGRMERSERHGMLEHMVYPMFGMFPWRCNACRERKFFQDRGERRIAHIKGPRRRTRDGGGAVGSVLHKRG